MTFVISIRSQLTFNTTENSNENLAELYSESGYTEQENYAQILQSLYVEFVKAVSKLAMANDQYLVVQNPYTMIPVIEEGTDVVAGYDVTISLNLWGVTTIDGRC